MVAEEDENFQKKGVVAIYYVHSTGDSPKLDSEFVSHNRRISECLPLRAVAFHFCYDDSRLRPAMTMVQLFIGPRGRIRFRPHFGKIIDSSHFCVMESSFNQRCVLGSQMECHYALMTFGIPRNVIPIGVDGRLDVTKHHRFLDQRKQIEEAKKALNLISGTIEQPLSMDVLLGRGRPYQTFPGNVTLAMLVDAERNLYKKADRFEKTARTRDIVRMIKATKGRFLKRTESGNRWVEVSDEVAREKVSHTFRTKTRRQTEDQMRPVSSLEFMAPVRQDTDVVTSRDEKRLRLGDVR